MRIQTIFLFTLLSFCSSLAFNQQSNTFKTILTKAGNENKNIWMYVQSNNCQLCNALAKTALNSDESIQYILKNEYIFYTTATIPSEIQPDTSVYYFPETFFGMIITDTKGNILAVDANARNHPNYYTNFSYNIKNKVMHGGSLLQQQLEAYNLNNKNFYNSYNLLKTILDYNMEPGNSLLNNIVENIPPDSVHSTTFIQTLAKAAPTVSSPLFKFLRKDAQLFSESWYQLPLSLRMTINSRILTKSLNSAIADTNFVYAVEAAQFIATTYNNKYEGNQQFDAAMLQYYYGIGDTTQYIQKALNYYDRYFPTTLIDSVHKADSIYAANNNEALMKQIKKMDIRNATENGNYFIKRTTIISPNGTRIASELHKGAKQLYEITNNVTYLNKALEWNSKSIQANLNADNANTQAKILYKLGKNKEAIQWEKTAINEVKKKNLDSEWFEQSPEKSQSSKS